ncbi:hypothetical protein QBC38DRAFT_468102 [Podospora fimiseda]|uniref:Secreted protein n=1 Tax=Podospora fimiseda TaxID=252190 RepID=A0AAN7BWJ8_9PEZI|nr:hypothetical protein QBC38DRAFT_468102 [Podospora fimiseda]
MSHFPLLMAFCAFLIAERKWSKRLCCQHMQSGWYVMMSTLLSCRSPGGGNKIPQFSSDGKRGTDTECFTILPPWPCVAEEFISGESRPVW